MRKTVINGLIGYGTIIATGVIVSHNRRCVTSKRRARRTPWTKRIYAGNADVKPIISAEIVETGLVRQADIRLTPTGRASA
jgi:hypothetical protein